MNQITRNLLFEKIWELWLRKENKPSAQKGFFLACAERDLDPKRVLTSVKIYLAEVKDPKYCKDLGKFFRDHHYLDIYENFREVDEYQSKLKEADELAELIVNSWNQKCKPHWIKVENIEDRKNLVKGSLYNNFFKGNWKRALDECEKIFSEKFEVGDWRRKIKPSLSWFCQTQYDSHTTARIIEGEFGSATPVEEQRKIPDIVDPATPDDVDAMFKDVFK